MTRPLLSALALLTILAIPSAGRAEDPAAREILRRAIEAVGGEGALNALKSPMMWMERGTYHGMGDGIPYVGQYAAKWPDWFRQEIENAFVITVSGTNAWVSAGGSATRFTGADLEERLKQARVAWAERLFPLTCEDYTLNTVDGVDVEGRATVGIQASHPDGRDLSLYFDEQTYLIAKTEAMMISPEYGPDPVLSEGYYSDHRSFAGVKMPARFRLFLDKKLLVEGETIDYKIHATLDPTQFEVPE